MNEQAVSPSDTASKQARWRIWVSNPVLIFSTTAVASVAALIQLMQPVRNGSVRLLVVLALFLSVCSLLRLTWRVYHLGKILFGLFFIIALCLGFSRQTSAPTDEHFTAALRSYEGVTYIWGGETNTGIDCSGLIRRSLMDAYLHEHAYAAAWQLWLIDCAAKDFATKYSTILDHVGSYSNIREIPDSEIHNAHIAVTKGGIHTLAHLGKRIWIQASPGARKVIIKSDQAEDPWFNTPIELYRLKR